MVDRDAGTRVGSTAAVIVVTMLAMPGVYYLAYLQVAYVLAFMGMHVRDLPAYYYTGGFFDVAGPIA